ncbi:hypothetical protein [Flavobacterium psychrophilum]|uniref:hypothetical protein n=1 Tax=Flavobacterium psychrophilum TaxID=96345 RepID=UPI000A9D4370|nr:hypothetical protein [Flavobacterium psychrophilum]
MGQGISNTGEAGKAITDANLKFITLKPKLIPATDTIIELIGKPLYDSLDHLMISII